MPFDGATVKLSTVKLSAQDVLEEALFASGREPINPCLLSRHKADQILRHAPGWAFRHQQVVALAQIGVLLMSVALFVILLSAHEVEWGLVGALTMFTAGASLLFVPVKGPARWRERPLADLRDVPTPIREASEDLQRRVPRVGFTVGELYQERVKLDPYLVAEYGSGRVVLGIWDGDQIIACA
jgi:hypothetical protein